MPQRSSVRIPPAALAGIFLGFFLGCCLGTRFVVSPAVHPVLAALCAGDTSALPAGDFLSVLCMYASYGFAFLLLSTTYIGFALLPAVFLVKGFTSATTVAAFLQSGVADAAWLAWLSVGLPGLFLIPALILLSLVSYRLSYALFRQKHGGMTDPPPERRSNELSAVFLLLPLAAAAECYAVPYLAKLII